MGRILPTLFTRLLKNCYTFDITSSKESPAYLGQSLWSGVESITSDYNNSCVVCNDASLQGLGYVVMTND